MTTITLPRATVERALEALYEETAWFGPTPKGAAAITALRAALAQQDEQKEKPWRCAYGANLYIDENGAPRSK